MINWLNRNLYLGLLLLSVLLLSIFILYKIPQNGLYYFSSLGDTKEQYVHFFNHFYDFIHNGELPFWSWEYGMGGSFWNDFGYYMLGDIFIWPMFLFPKSFFPALFLPMTIIKMLLMSLGAYWFFKKTGVREHWSFLGALIYPFAGYHFDYFYTHYFFINAAVYFPFLLLGYERILQNKKPGLFILVVLIASIGNFYLMFLLSIGLFIFAVFRYFHQETIKKSLKGFLFFHLRLGLSYLTGLGLSMPFFLPSVFSYLESNAQARSGPSFDMMLSFADTMQRILVTGGMHYLFFATIPLLLIGFKFRRLPLFFLSIFLWASVQFPLLTSIIGGFSKPEELRGFFILNLLSLFIAVHTLNNLKNNVLNFASLILGSTLISFWLWHNPISRYSELLYILPGFWLAGILAAQLLTSQNFKKAIFMFTSLICVSYSVLLGYSFITDLIVKTNKTDISSIKHQGIWSTIPLLNKEIYENSYEDKSLESMLNEVEKQDPSFYRLVPSIPGVTAINSSLTYDYKGFYSYQSLIPWKQQKFEMDVLAQPIRSFNLIRGFGNSTYLTSILSNKYYIAQNNTPKLYGYHLEDTFGDTKVFRNEHFLPLGFVYAKAMSTEQFLSLPVYLREQVMLNYVIKEDAPLVDDARFNNYVISDTQDITVNVPFQRVENGIKINSEKPFEIKIPAPVKSNGQLYVYAHLLPNTPHRGVSIFAKSDLLGELKYIKNMSAGSFVLSQYHYEDTVDEVLFRFGEADQETKEITLSISPGEYVIKDIKVLLDPMDDYKKQINILKENTLNNLKYNSTSLSGTLKTSTSGTLFLSIPFNKGWVAKIDGERTEIFPAHYTFSGIEVKPGTHEIELYFIPPGLIPGILVSAVTLITLIIYYNRKKKKNSASE
ncbi:YfhO family protein [Fictibacillus sp. UD]|uniref:YfhO family protein n=1 Tax=Fictibacillus sp. UD TaxID=3038777 RepID=UPI003746684A